MKPLITLFHILSFLVHSILAQDASPSTDAPITENNPDRATFQAVLQQDKPVQGQITGVSNDNGTGVNFNVNFFNFPDDDDAGPFSKSPRPLHLFSLKDYLPNLDSLQNTTSIPSRFHLTATAPALQATSPLSAARTRRRVPPQSPRPASRAT